MFCPFCGTSLEDAAKFCTKCGKSLQESSPKPPSDNSLFDVPPPEPLSPPAAAPTSAATTPAPAPEQKEFKIPPRPKKPNPLTQKKTWISIGFYTLLAVLYAASAVLLLLLASRDGSIGAVIASRDKTVDAFSLNSFADLLTDGNYIFNPTALSTALGILIRALLWSVCGFSIIAFLGVFSRKKSASLYTSYCILTGIASLTVAFITPLASSLVPQLKYAVSVAAGVLTEDLASLSFLPLIIGALLAVLPLVAAGIVLRIFNNRRNNP